MESRTLAAALGTSAHLSPLLRKARLLGLDAKGLEELAIARGCKYYSRPGEQPAERIPRSKFSDVELAIALLNPALRYSPQSIRLGAAMLSAHGNTISSVANLARMERCEALVRYIANAGRRYEPQNPFWEEILESIPNRPAPDPSVVPHPTRFVALTGITRESRTPVAQWIRP